MDEQFAYLGPVKVEIIPAGQKLQSVGPQIVITRFTDIGIYHPRLIDKILEQEKEKRETAPTQSRFLGGQKLYRANDWNYPEIDLLDARVEALFHQHTKMQNVCIDHSWINIYRRHDYIAPHAHRRTSMSAVYCVAEGDTDVEDPISGSFCFVDPRLEQCCQERKFYMTTPMHIRLRAGSLLMFPAQLTHMVTPYEGDNPRITMAWNLDTEHIPGSPFHERINEGTASTG